MTDFNDDKHLDVCRDIELGLKRQYELHPDLTDTQCIFALDNAKIAVKKHFGFAKNQRVPDHPLTQGIILGCVVVADERVGKINDLSLQEYLDRIEKIKRSVIRHSKFGARGYYEFIREYI